MKPILKLYRGYANDHELIVMGHVFKPTSKEDYDFQKKNFKNAKSVIRMFCIKTQKNASVYLEHNGLKIHTKTLDDGYFKFCIPLARNLEYGWNEYKVSLFYEGQEISCKGSYIRPYEGNWGFISDIDDTFLVSHTRNAFRKLYILLFRNVNDRKIFEDVVPHYQALSSAGRSSNDEK
ncbi:MAG TPA: phosphatase domain-containing protein, partial [Flavobacterium sp.]|nr:phosphatase domain-containing protein [Flavobacterium sp.]